MGPDYNTTYYDELMRVFDLHFNPTEEDDQDMLKKSNLNWKEMK